ncbi:MAG TPA: OmpA family protein [Micropepsaceae bacterium]|nr:OmpA family protein [Micropepsaceae bacterium]
MKKTIISLLLLSAAVSVTPASANWFSNPRLGINLNVGSAPNPKPADLEALYGVEETRTVVAEAPPAPPPPPYVPPAYVEPAPPPPPAAAVIPAPREFMVFFDFDKSNLTPEARDIVSAAVKTAKDRGAVRIVVTGHTDTVGSFRYNQALSERRANSVKAEMVRQGMDRAMIATVGKSFSDPLVATGPGVREPQNRRAVIDLGSGAIASAE